MFLEKENGLEKTAYMQQVRLPFTVWVTFCNYSAGYKSSSLNAASDDDNDDDEGSDDKTW